MFFGNTDRNEGSAPLEAVLAGDPPSSSVIVPLLKDLSLFLFVFFGARRHL